MAASSALFRISASTEEEDIPLAMKIFSAPLPARRSSTTGRRPVSTVDAESRSGRLVGTEPPPCAGRRVLDQDPQLGQFRSDLVGLIEVLALPGLLSALEQVVEQTADQYRVNRV